MTRQGVAVRLWDVATGAEKVSMARADQNIHVMAFVPHSTLLATTAFDREDAHTLRLWDAESGKEVGKIPGYPGGTRTISFHPGGRLLALTSGTSCDVGRLPPSAAVLWDLTAERPR